MLEPSAGRKLCEARLARRLTVEEAAHAVRMRPDKILALEDDDYTRFGGTAYARGFLQIYSRFLDVDVSSQLRSMEPSDHRVRVDEYQYLNSPPPVETSSPSRNTFQRDRSRPPSVVPLLVFMAIFVLGGGGMYLYKQGRRMEIDKVPTPSVIPSDAAPAPAAPSEQPGPTATEPAPAGPNSLRLAEQTLPAALVPQGGIGLPGQTMPLLPGTAVNELIVEPIKKTWVTIRKDSSDTPPVFEDFIYPGYRPLKLKGARFFVEVRDQSAVQIRKNGAPIAYQAPGISIQ